MSKSKEGQEENSNSSEEDNESSTNSSSLKNSLKKKDSKNSSKDININSYDNRNKNNSSIVEVYEENFIQEIKNLISLIKEYNYIGMDTEFPGIVYSLSNLTDDFYYK